ncbi:MAG: TatD family hydrolase [Candidatus Diapherotrites archaeon]
MLADIHCHLDEFQNPEEQIRKAKKTGVFLILSNSVDLKSMQKNLAISKKFDIVRCALGIHPNEINKMAQKDIDSAFAFVEENIASCSAIGETGLDFKYADEQQKSKQVLALKRHIEIANSADMAILVHSRMAREECLEMLEKNDAKKVVLHWFVSGEKLLEKALSLGYYISIGPSVLFEKHVQEFAKLVPPQNMLFETDAPVEYNGKRAEPAWVKEVSKKVAEIKSIEHEKLCNTVEKNLKALF